MTVTKEELLKQRFGIRPYEIPDLGEINVRPLTRAEAVHIADKEMDKTELEAYLLSCAMVEPKLTSSAVRCCAFTGPGPPSPTDSSWARAGRSAAQNNTTKAQAAASRWESEPRIFITLDCRLFGTDPTGREPKSVGRPSAGSLFCTSGVKPQILRLRLSRSNCERLRSG